MQVDAFFIIHYHHYYLVLQHLCIEIYYNIKKGVNQRSEPYESK